MRSQDSHQRTSLREWLAVVSIAGGTFALVMAQFLPIGLMSSIARDLQITQQQSGLLVTIPGLISAVAAPLLLVASGNLDRRYVIWLLTSLLIVSDVVVSIGDNLLVMLMGSILLGIGAGGFWALGTALAGRLVAPRSVSQAMTLVFGGVSAGIVLGVPAGTLLGHAFGWRVAFMATAGLTLIVLVAQILLLPRVKPTKAITLPQLSAVFRAPQARVALLGATLVVVGQFMAYTYITPILEHYAKASPTAISFLLFAFGAAGFFGNFIGGAWVQRNVYSALTIITLMLGSMLILLPFLVTNEVSATILVIIWGLFYGGVPIGFQTWALMAAPNITESAGAVFIAVFQFAVAGGAMLGGIIVERYSLSANLILGGIAVLITFLIISCFSRARVIS